jgi:sugar lactone lactonase YvrE
MRLASVLLSALLVLVGVPTAAHAAHPAPFPDVIALPNGFPPEGIAINSKAQAFFGSRTTGAIYRADLRTGTGRIINEGPGTPSLGMKIDGRGRLFVAGGSGADARVLSTRTGEVLASYTLTTSTAFINDVVLTRGAAWFTDSTNPFLYKVAIGRGGALAAESVALPLTGDIVYGTGINANGISETPDGRGLLVMQSSTATLFRVDPATGVATAVDLGGEALTNGDGLLLNGRTLYVVQNRLNQVAVIKLNRAGTAGEIVNRLTDADFDVPTTVAAFGNRLYLPNARFGVTTTPETPYSAVAIPRG